MIGAKLVPDITTGKWIENVDAALLAKTGSSPGGQVIAENIRMMLAAAPVIKEPLPWPELTFKMSEAGRAEIRRQMKICNYVYDVDQVFWAMISDAK